MEIFEFVMKSLPKDAKKPAIVKVRSDRFKKLMEFVLDQETPVLEFYDEEGRRVIFQGPKRKKNA